MFPKRFGLFDKKTGPFSGRLGFRGGISFEWMSGVMIATWSLICSDAALAVGQGGHLVQRTSELLDGFHQRRALQRPLPRLAPQVGRLLDQPRLGVVTRQQLRLALGDICKLAFEGIADTGMKRPSRLGELYCRIDRRATGSTDGRSLPQLIKDHNDVMGPVYEAYARELSEAWKSK